VKTGRTEAEWLHEETIRLASALCLRTGRAIGNPISSSIHCSSRGRQCHLVSPHEDGGVAPTSLLNRFKQGMNCPQSGLKVSVGAEGVKQQTQEDSGVTVEGSSWLRGV